MNLQSIENLIRLNNFDCFLISYNKYKTLTYISDRNSYLYDTFFFEVFFKTRYDTSILDSSDKTRIHTFKLINKSGLKEYFTASETKVFDELGNLIRVDAILKNDTKDILNQNRFNKIERLTKIGYWDFNIEKNELYWSDEIFRIFNLDKAVFHPSYQNFLENIHPEDRNMVNEAYTKSLIDKQPYKITHRLLVNDTIKFVEEQCETDFNEDDEPIISRGTVYDITEKIERMNKLEEHANVDFLTNIFNRMKFTTDLNNLFSSIRDNDKKFGIILLDIDNFKSINDTFGHPIGDKVLVEFTNIIRKKIRDDDIIYRWGGEEFAIVLKNIHNKDDCTKLASKIHKLLNSHIFNSINKIVTASIGIVFKKENDTMDTMVKRVDDRMYKAKNSGKNKVVSD